MLTRQELSGVFPTNSSILIFLLYMAMFVAHGLLVTKSREGSASYPYNVTTVVLITELVKCALSLATYLFRHSVASFITNVRDNLRVLKLYLVPASLYCLYNNLSFYSLAYFNPTSYFMFLQIRLLLTGVMYQIVFKKTLSRTQWFSLLILTVGCMIHASGTGKDRPEPGGNKLEDLTLGIFFILVQVLCSVFAGVYNEYIIKGAGSDVHIMIQNVFMYLDSILCNVLLLGIKGELSHAFSQQSLLSVWQILVLALVLNNAVLGIVTSLFLKTLNSIVKAFASAIELVLTALLSIPILGIPLSVETVGAILLISVAVVTYAKNPVKIDEAQLRIAQKPEQKASTKIQV